ncbi:MAG: DUF4127 family protein [Acidobacteria bacterium]|nr:DUF4127 family protein [Acidobacteriota bacterium]
MKFGYARTYMLLGLLAIVLGLIGQAQDSKKQDPRFHPVPMNPGPLGSAGYLTLLPIDDRPAVGQFAQMIGAVADHKVTLPPKEMLGRFTTPGDTARIELWLKSQDYSKADALIVSVDMLAYGGLVASRTNKVSFDEAKKRLEFFRWFKAKYPRVPVYAFNVIMRVAPTATAAARGIHDKLARWAELKDRAPTSGDKKLEAELNQLTRELAPTVIDDYLAARKRDLQINLAMLDLAKAGTVNELILLQDDARPFGLHRQDQAVLRTKLKELGLESKVPIYNGADEGSLSLVSRAVLDKFLYKLKVAVVYSSEKSRDVIAPYEDHPLQFTVENQIRAAGGIPVSEFDQSDYRLFINAPGTSDEEFDLFLKKLLKELKENRHIALADVLFPAPHHSGADERIIAALKRESLFDRFAGYAAWNTAGNTLGMAIPHANMRVFFRSKLNDRADRAARTEAAHLVFLLNRFAGDYLFHDIVQLEINERLRAEAKTDEVTYEFTPERYTEINREVGEKMKAQIERFFADYFKSHTHRLAIYKGVEKTITVNGLKDLFVYLPWARAFECAIEFKLDYSAN